MSLFHIEHLHIHTHSDEGIRDALSALQQGVRAMTATIQEVLDDLDTIKNSTADYIASRDSIDTRLKAELAAAVAALATSEQHAADLQAGIDQVFAKAEAAKDLLTPPVPAPAAPADAPAPSDTPAP